MVRVIAEPLLSERLRRLRESLLQIKPRLSCERLVLLKESYQETKELPPVIRRAKLLDAVMSGMTIFIDDNPIVGTLTQYRGGVQPYPEYSCKWMKRETEFQTLLGRGELTEEEKKLIEETVDYWRDRCLLSQTKQVWTEKYGGTISRDDIINIGVWHDVVSTPEGRISVDYGKVVNKGLNAVVGEVEAELKKLPIGNVEVIKKRHFGDAVVIACNAVIKFANRYALLAEEMFKTEDSPERKAELLRIAETCRWVPANPARTFHEAIQAFWFTHLACLIEHCSYGFSPGRFTQYMYPSYKRDKEAGRLTDEETMELLQLLFIKYTELGSYQPRRGFEETMASMYQNLALGGIDSDGKDATNELDYLVLEAQKRLRVVQPTLSVLYHDKLPEELLLKAADVVRTGIGMPAFFNNDLMIQRHLNHGASLEDARNSCIIGCVETGFAHTANSMWGSFFSMPKILELALNNGKDPRTGKQIGLQTGDATKFGSLEELEEAIGKQLEYFVRLYCEFEYTGHAIKADLLPTPFTSALVDDCIKNGKDVNSGGSRYSMDGFGPVGTVDMADSLVAINRLVFEKKKVTMEGVLEALKVNFEGKAELQHMLLEAPKYGNDDEEVDQIVRRWYAKFYEEHQKYTDHLGRQTRPYAISITEHFALGNRVGALPSGRQAWLPLTDGSVSPEPGKDRKGPTALIRSATRVIDTTKYGSGQLNMKFHPTALQNIDGLKKLIALVKTYIDLGGHHLQFNVVSSDTLRDAQLHPENYQDLIVRVAGFSAFFIHLDPVVQNEIIKRTELTFS